MNTLRQQMLVDLNADILDTNNFAETVTYVPQVGPARRVNIDITHSSEYASGTMLMEQVHTISIVVGRNETHANGGVSMPQLGDAIIRDGDIPGVVYSWTGEVMDSEDHYWALKFERRKPHRVGAVA